MSSPQSQRIQTSCATIWGNGDYDIDIETDDWVSYYAVVKKDFGDSFGPPLTITGICNSENHVWRELDRMLGLWARVVQSGQPMTEDQNLEIFGGPNGQNKPILRKFIALMNKKGLGLLARGQRDRLVRQSPIQHHERRLQGDSEPLAYQQIRTTETG